MSALVDGCARVREREGRLDVDGLLAEMDSWGIERAAVAAPDRFVAVDNEEGNRLLERIAHEHRDRIVGLASANPWYGSRAVAELGRAFDAGLAGLYLNPGRQGFQLSESLVDPLVEVCARFSRAVYASTGTPGFAMPFQLAELARRFPAVRFVMGHAGWTDFSGYDNVPAAEQAQNVLVDTSCTIGSVVAATLAALGPARVIFCSAYPRSRAAVELAKLRRLEWDERTWRLVTGENARELWRMG